MRKFVVSFLSVLFVSFYTFAFAAMPGNVAPPVNTLLQFTSGGHVIGFTPNKVYIAGMGHALTEEFINPNTVTPKPLSSHTVTYENLWKGINLTYEARKTGIAESIYTVSPGSDINNIRIRYNADVTIQKNGTLTFNHPTSNGSYTMNAPIAWQEKHGTKIPVQVSYAKLSDTAIGFTTGPYDKTLPLVIDPVYKWHTFYGSSDYDYGYGIAVDTSGNIYITGYSEATWGSPINPHSGSRDIVVLKLAEILSPVEGTIGTKVTINGTGFGDKKGKVLINGTVAKIEKGGWAPDQITCTISKPPLPVDVAHPVSVVVNKVSMPLDGTFTLRLPALDELSVTSGAYPDPIKVTGKFFGTKKGKVYLYDLATDKKKSLKITDWKMNESTGISEITFVVPKPSKALPGGLYQLKISNKIGAATTTPEFTVLEPGP